MKRKLLAMLTVLLLLVTMVTPAFADVIWEPDNDFHRRHRDECTYHNRTYLANGEKGYVTVRTAPNSVTEIMNLANGTRFCVDYIWTDEDGTQWGIGYEAGKFNGEEGWVPLSDMAMIYDYISFEEDHGHEFQEYDGSGDELTKAYLYSYPGGVFCDSIIDEEWGYMPFAEAFTYLYTDENGLRWTFIGYYMGRQNRWLCIDDPMNDELGTGDWNTGYLTVAQVREDAADLRPSVDNIPPAMTWYLWAIPVVLILAVIVVTAVIARKRRLK